MIRVSTSALLACLFLSAPALRGADPRSTTMPAVEVSNQPLERVLANIRGKVPDFHFAVFRSAGTPADYPKLPEMSVDGVSIDQFLELVKHQYPDIKIDVIAGNNYPLYSIRIDDTENKNREEARIRREYAVADLSSKQVELARKQALFKEHAASQSEVEEAELSVKLAQTQVSLATLEAQSGGAAEKTMGAGVTKTPPVVKVIRLDEVLATSKPGTDPKKATDDILSLIQATMDADGSDPKDQPVLKVHQPTQTLIFKGSPEKLAVLEQALESLKPKVDEHHVEMEKLKLAHEQMASAFAQMRNDFKRQQDENHELQTQLLATKAELGQAQGQLSGITWEQRQKEDRQKLIEEQRQTILAKIRAVQLESLDPKNPQSQARKNELENLKRQLANLDQQSPSTQPAK